MAQPQAWHTPTQTSTLLLLTLTTWHTPTQTSTLLLLTLTTWQMTGQKFHKFVKNLKIIERYYYIWNPHGKCIEISTNMPGIG